MAAERPAKPPAADGDAMAPQARPRAGATRCPFCHDDCPPGAEVCVCGDCLSRHHLACWDERGRCASCDGRQRLLVAERAGAQHKPVYDDVVEGWFRLGKLFNVSLVAITVLTLRGALLRLWPNVFLGAVIANLCFLVGGTRSCCAS